MERDQRIEGYICNVNCGDSGKCQFLKEFNGWFMSEEMDKIFDALTEDIKWDMTGEQPLRGVDQVKEMFSSVEEEVGEDFKMKKMVVEKILIAESDGIQYGLSTGYSMMANGSRYAFNDLVTFASGRDDKISEINTLMVEVKDEDRAGP